MRFGVEIIFDFLFKISVFSEQIHLERNAAAPAVLRPSRHGQDDGHSGRSQSALHRDREEVHDSRVECLR